MSKNGAAPQEISGGKYAVSEAGTYTFTAKTQAGTQATVQKTVYAVRVGESAEVVVSGGWVAQRGNPTGPAIPLSSGTTRRRGRPGILEAPSRKTLFSSPGGRWMGRQWS